MAKGNMFLGMSRGSVGDVTFYRGYGQQLARARNRNPRNPRSDAQVIQRAILATASKAYSRMKSVVDHSFQSVQYGARSQSYFLRRAMDDIRAWVADTLPITGEYPTELRNPLLYRGLATPTNAFQSGVGLLISEGSIPSVVTPLSVPSGGDAVVAGFGYELPGTEGATILEVMNSFGAVVGDQISVVAVGIDGVFYRSRYVINADASAADLAVTWDPSGAAAAFDASKTDVGALFINPDDRYMYPGGVECMAAAVILSRKVGDTWQRSTQRLVWLSDAGDYATTDTIINEWMAGTTPIDTINPRFLNQAEE